MTEIIPFKRLYNRYAKILSRIKAKQSRNERPSIRDDIFMSRLSQHKSLVEMTRFDFLHNDFNHFTKEKKVKPKRPKIPVYVTPSFSDTLMSIPRRSELPAMPQTQQEQKCGLLYGKFDSEHAQQGILHKDGTFTILPPPSKEKKLYDF